MERNRFGRYERTSGRKRDRSFIYRIYTTTYGIVTPSSNRRSGQISPRCRRPVVRSRAGVSDRNRRTVRQFERNDSPPYGDAAGGRVRREQCREHRLRLRCLDLRRTGEGRPLVSDLLREESEEPAAASRVPARFATHEHGRVVSIQSTRSGGLVCERGYTAEREELVEPLCRGSSDGRRRVARCAQRLGACPSVRGGSLRVRSPGTAHPFRERRERRPVLLASGSISLFGGTRE